MGGEGCEDRLRAIGWLLDERGARLEALALTGDRVTVRVAEGGGASRAVVLRAGDLALLRSAARDRRGGPALPEPGTGYQALLRALGRLADECEARACRLRTEGGGLVAELLAGAGESAAWRTIQLDRDA